MEKIFFLSVVITLGFFLHGARAGYEQGNDNPTGVSGIYNGNITTGCSYDSSTGNAHRAIDDIVVPGSVGAYPLKWTRYWNSHMTYAAGSNGGWNFSYLGYQYDNSRSITYFPDGRAIDCRLQCPYGYEEMDGPFGPRDGGQVTYQIFGGSPYYYLAMGLVDPYGNVTSFTHQQTTPYLMTKITEPGGRYLQIQYNANYQVQTVQAFDGIAGHPAMQSVTYTWSTFQLHDGPTQVLSRVDYSDGTYATYTYTDQSYPGPPVCTYPFTSTAYHAALLATADDVRYTGPMRQIAYQYYARGNKTRILSENNFVTGEAVSTIAGVTSNGTTGATETRGDGLTRTFHYYHSQHCVDCPPPDTEPCSNPIPTDGKLKDYTDFLGHTTTIGYDSNGFVNSVTDPNNHTTTYTRGTGPGQQPWAIYQITHQVDSTYITQTYSNNNPPYLGSRTDELNHTTTYHRDSNNRIQEKDYPDGGWETFQYNSFGEVLTHVRAKTLSPLVTETETFVYDSRGLKTSWTDAAGGMTTYTYYTSSDLGGVWTDRLKTVTHPVNVSGFQETETYEYDKTFVNGVDTGAACSGRGIVTKVTHTDGSYITYTHNKWGDVLTTTDELGHTQTTSTYDDYGRVLTTTTPPRFPGDTQNHTTSMSYVPSGKTSSEITTSKLPWVTTLPSTKKTNTYYDGNWRKTRVQQAPGTGDEANTYFYYDTYGTYTSISNLLATQDPRNYVTRYHYDNRDRQDQITDALGASLGDANHTTSFTFDACGNKLTETHPKPDANTNAELIEYDQYDPMNRLKHKKVHRDATTIDQTSMTYDAAGNLQTNTDENGNVYSYTYDNMNRRTGMTYPLDNLGVQRTEASAYDSAGNPSTYTNRAGSIQTFAYDNRNRQTGFSWSNDPASTTGQTTVYDVASRKTQIVNNDATIKFTYYNDNKLWTQEEWSMALSDNVHRTVTYTYDPDGNRATIQYPSGSVFNYSYTQRNQMSTIVDASQHTIISYTFDSSGNITARTVDNGTSTSYAPDAVNRDTSVVHTLISGPRRFDYAYNNVNDVTVVQRDSGNGDGYKYDLTQEITDYYQNGSVSLTNGTISGWATSTDLTFDGCGNRKTFNGLPLSTPNALNQPTDAGISHAISGNQATWNGNLQVYNGWSYSYDAQNRLRSATKGTTTAAFYYDGLNRQCARLINNVATFSVWDGDWAILEEYGRGNIVTEKYLQGYHGLVKTFVSNIYYYQDELGSTSHVANASGNLLEWYKYDLYGKPTYWDANNNLLPSGSGCGVKDLFTGQRLIPELGLYDDRNRFMSPELGRFLQPDPIGFKGDASNLYRYCGNDWANKSDPMGLDVVPSNPDQWQIKIEVTGTHIPASRENVISTRQLVGLSTTHALSAMSAKQGLTTTAQLSSPASPRQAEPASSASTQSVTREVVGHDFDPPPAGFHSQPWVRYEYTFNGIPSGTTVYEHVRVVNVKNEPPAKYKPRDITPKRIVNGKLNDKHAIPFVTPRGEGTIRQSLYLGNGLHTNPWDTVLHADGLYEVKGYSETFHY